MGNLVAGLVTEDALRQLFNTTMAAAFPAQAVPGLDAVVSVSMHSEGRYAFVELRTPDMASAALQLSNQASVWAAYMLGLSFCAVDRAWLRQEQSGNRQPLLLVCALDTLQHTSVPATRLHRNVGYTSGSLLSGVMVLLKCKVGCINAGATAGPIYQCGTALGLCGPHSSAACCHCSSCCIGSISGTSKSALCTSTIQHMLSNGKRRPDRSKATRCMIYERPVPCSYYNFL